MTITEVQKEILRLKKEKDILILVHSYQSRDIIEIADIVGDSFALSVKAKEAKNKTILMCGVRFMAETAKLLSPDKTVLLSSPLAGCPMAEQFSKEDILKLKEENPNAAVVCYVNTTAELKTVCDYCVTSSSALRIVKEIPNEEIIFIPDINLGSYVKANVPDKKFTLLQGGCPVHGIITEQEALAAKALHPNALLLVHPECKPEVTKYADVIGSTADIINFAKSSEKKEFIIGTEISIVEYLQFECPDKSFYPLSTKICCKDMKATTLVDVLNCLNGTAGEEIILDDDTMANAVRCINRMIKM
ncbi:MAG: quinolinate synthase NadA [Ruminococcus sp.]|nr:quinolinate synthase NadA [Ruminococcus sp.]